MEGYQVAPYASRALVNHFSNRYLQDRADYFSVSYYCDPALFSVEYKDIRISLRIGRDGIFIYIGDFFHGRYTQISREDDMDKIIRKLIFDMELLLYDGKKSLTIKR